MSRERMRIGVVGLGYWGANVARNLAAMPECELAWCCDSGGEATAASVASARFTTELEEMLGDDALDAVAVATPVPDHVATATRVLAAGKHCFVEKPLSRTVAAAEELTALAESRGRVLMVGHLLEYHPGIEALRALVDAGELGDIRYIYSQRLNLGRLRSDENALWSLGAHDVSVALALAGELPAVVSARGESYVRAGVEDVVFAHLRFPSGIVAHMHLSWLDPHKERRLTVVGSRRMASFDDMAAERKLTIFDKGFDPDGEGTDAYVARSGSSRSPAVGRAEPLRLELEHFVDRMGDGGRPRSDGASGIRVVRVLEGLQRSLDSDGAAVELDARTALA